MATLAADKSRAYELGEHNDLPVIAADIIYEGSAVGDNGAGYARPLVAGDPFRGFAFAKADNSAGAAGDINVRVRRCGDIVLPIAALAITDVGKDVYASDDDTFTLTQSTNTRIGKVKRFIATGSGVVCFCESNGGAQVAEITDSTGGVVSDTIANTAGAAPTTAEFENAVASIVDKINYLIRRLGN